jgi:hypothetical protein
LQRRRGQALLLAVLLMIFVALLGSTFVTVVALNMNQTARQEDLSGARTAAQAGINFVNTNLTYSAEGGKWRPEKLSPPPAPGDNGYNDYYTPFEQAQGWARTVPHPAGWDANNPDFAADWAVLEAAKANGARVFVKIPDPRLRSVPPGTPTYLAEVRPIPTDPSAPGYNPATAGMLKIEVIGRSDDQTSVFDRRIAYKGGYPQNPFLAAARSVTNWDFLNNTVPVGTTAAAAAIGATTLTVSNIKGNFPANNFYVTVGNPTNTAPQTLLVQASAQTGTTATFTVAPALATAIGVNTRVEMAAVLGVPATIDYDADADPADATREAINLSVAQRYDSTRATETNRPGGVRVNGGLGLQGTLFLPNLSTPSLASNLTGFVKASGLISNNWTSGTANVAATATLERLLYKNDDNTTGEIPAATLNNSGSNQLVNFTTSTGAAPSQRSLDQLVSDGRNRLTNNVSSTTRQVESFTPPRIDTVGQDTGRYRQMSKFSPPNPTAPNPTTLSSTSALHGYGQGIYIDNEQDREKIGVAANQYREMTQTEFRDMLFSNSAASNYLRLGTPIAPSDAQSSLEQQHLRGWIGPDEFRGRGALVEIDPRNGLITITRDSITDGTDPATATTVAGADELSNEGPVSARGWKDADGDLIGGANGGVYRRTFPWPANGVIMAEGNIRIKGGAFTTAGDVDTSVIPPRSLTVVSMNNIYIEGSINAGARKVALLAKRNVILNPTALTSRVEGQTRLRGNPTSATIDVWNSSLFRAGDFIQLGRSNDQPSQVEEVINANDGIDDNDQLRLASPLPSGATGQVITLVKDPKFGTNFANAVPYNNFATRLERVNHYVQRRLNLLPGATQARIAIRHNAERKNAMTFKADHKTIPTGTDVDSARLANKLLPIPSPSALRVIHKLLNIEYEETGAGTSTTETFTTPTPATTGDVSNPTTPQDLTFLEKQMETTGTGRPATSGSWSYTVSVDPNYNPDRTIYTTYQQPLFHFMASVGNRYDNRPDPNNLPPGTLPYRRDILANAFTVPMGTSVQLRLNGTNATIQSDYFNTGDTPAPGAYETVPQFGFNPAYGVTASPEDRSTWEDVLTIDHNFYRNHATITDPANIQYDNAEYTLDSRIVSIPAASASTDGINTLSFHLNLGATVPGGSTVGAYFPAADVGTSQADIPFYRLSRIKLENLVLGNGTPDRDLTQIAPGATIRVNAFVYAQEGSWMVIPGDYFDDKVRSDASGAYVDQDNSIGRTPGENIDLNRDGVVSRAEQAAVFRFRRYNYSLNFTGSIMENRTAVVNDPDGNGPLYGSVAEWTDKWATTNFNLGTTTTFNPDTLSTTAGNLGTMNYNFDVDAQRGFIDANNNNQLDATEIDLTQDSGFHPPMLPELIYQS